MIWLFAFALFFSVVNETVADDSLVVNAEFLELHTGAGRGYPVVNVVEHGELFYPLLRKYDWIKVAAGSGVEGWISYKDFLAATRLQTSNHRKKIARSRWQLGGRTGLFKSDPFYSGFLGVYPLSNVGVCIEAGQIAGKYSSSTMLSGSIIFVFLRDSLLSPNFTIGFGSLVYSPRDALLNASKEQYGFFRYGAGVTYSPYKRLALEVSVNNTAIADIESYLGAAFAVSVFYD